MNDKGVWLWQGWVPHGHLSMICGVPGSGKSLIAAWLATTALRGRRFPDGAQIEADETREIMWISTAGTYQRLIERLKLMDAPLKGVFWPLDPQDPKTSYPMIDVTQDRWLGIVAALAAEARPAWVIIDAIDARRGEIVGIHRTLEVMAGVARDIGCAVTFLYQQDGARTTGRGRSAEWAHVAGKVATIMALKRWAPATRDMRFKVIKTALGDRPDPLRLRFDTDTPEVVHRSLAPPQSPVDRAVAFLELELAGGPRSAFEVTDRAWWKNKISPRTLQRAKRQLEVKSYKSAGRWWWILG